MCYPMARTLLRMKRRKGKSAEPYGYDMVEGFKTVGFRSDAPAGPFYPLKALSGAPQSAIEANLDALMTTNGQTRETKRTRQR